MKPGEKWVPRPNAVDVFPITLEGLQELKSLLGATDVRSAYVRGGEVVVEWTMMHREVHAGIVGQYIVRNARGEIKIMDKSELRSDYMPLVEGVADGPVFGHHPELGEILAVHHTDGVPDEVLFALPDGTPAQFVLKKDTNDIGTPEEVVAGLQQELASMDKEDEFEEKTQVRKDEKPKKGPSPADIHKAAQKVAPKKETNDE